MPSYQARYRELRNTHKVDRRQAIHLNFVHDGGLLLCRQQKMRTSMQVLHVEAVLMGMNAKAETARQWCSATDKAADILLQDDVKQAV